MSFSQEPVFLWLAQYAYHPEIVYLAVFGMMIASGFGLPIPEEVTIVSVGILTYMGAHPDLFPPPYPGAPVVDGYEAALVTFLSVAFADLMIFSMGRIFGRKLMRKDWFKKLFPEPVMLRVNEWMRKYGVFAAFIFRFTPGLRFPAHVAMGMTNFPVWQFALVDAFAALISVPTQILLIYHYGEPILKAMKEFKFIIFGLLGCLIIFFLVRRFVFRRLRSSDRASES
jgi:membrane protein DedA with SNARE-associated domain